MIEHAVFRSLLRQMKRAQRYALLRGVQSPCQVRYPQDVHAAALKIHAGIYARRVVGKTAVQGITALQEFRPCHLR